MSIRLDAAGFTAVLERAMRSCTPATYRQQQAWLIDWKTATARMHYLDVNQATICDTLRSLIRIKGKLRKPNLSLEFIKPDVENLWIDAASQASEAAHTFYNNDSGFECAFVAVTDQGYITGSISISRHV